jgi:N-acetylmuramoyl-L-alanine amidase
LNLLSFRSLRLCSAVVVAVALVVGATLLDAQGAALTLLSRDGRRAIPIVMSGSEEMVALDQLASVFSLAVREEAGAVTVSYRGRTIVLTPGQPLASVSGRVISLEAPLTRSGREWLVSLDFISRALAPIYDTPLDLRRPSRLLVVGNLRVPRIAVRYEDQPTGGRVTIDTTPRTTETVTQDGDRLLVRYDADALDGVLPRVSPGGLLQNLRLVDATTLAVDLGPAFAGYHETTQSVGTAGRVVLELAASRPEPLPAPPAPPSAARPAAPSAGGPPKPAPSFTSSPASIRTIVIDPGHGGNDPGVAGPNGTTEKEVTLDVAQRLKTAIEGRLGIRVLMTRESDRIVPIDQRTALANNNKADLFISLHANASFRPSTSGATIFCASFEQAGDATAQDLLKGQTLPAFGGGSRDLEMVLWDLAQIRHVDQSQAFAAVVQKQFRNRVPLSARPIQRAPLRVLESANMPAVVIEMGYLTNADDAKRLANADQQGVIAQALFDAVQRFRDLLAGGES